MTRLRGRGLVLREWSDVDLPSMVELFDDPEVDAWTPLESPFTPEAARRYLEAIAAAKRGGTVRQWAITEDGDTPLGTVLVFTRGEDPVTAEIGYIVGAAHRGRGLAVRAVTLVMTYAAHKHDKQRFLLRIAQGNSASQAVALRCGFRLADQAAERHEVKGRTVDLAVWERTL